MVRFEDRIRVKINFDATDVAKAVAAAQLALSDIDEREFNKSMERVDSRLAQLETREPDFDIGGELDRSSIERAKEQAEEAAEGVERIKIGGEVWNKSITTAVQNAKRKIQSEYESQGKERLEIGGELDQSDLQADLEAAEQTAEAKIIRIPLRFKVHTRSLGGAMLAAQSAVKAHGLFNKFKIPIRAKVDRGSFDAAVAVASQKAATAMAAGKKKAIQANKKLTKSAVQSTNALGGENNAAAQVAATMGSGTSSLTKAKMVAAQANTQLGKQADKTHKFLRKELGVSRSVADQLVPLSRRSEFAGMSMRALRESVDDTTRSMRASGRVGNMFEDALGKLSVNVGAFTIALRNLATQIPIILGTISAIGSAALGAATALVTATFALVGMFAGGLIAQAEQMRDTIAGIETTAEALQEIFSRLKALFREAFAPIIDIAEAGGFFTRIIEGLAVVANLMAQGIAALTDEITFMLDALGEQGIDAFNETVAASVFAVKLLKDEFVDILSGIFRATAAVIVFSAEFIDGFTEAGSLTDSLGSLLGDLAKTVQNVFQGALPILNGFREILASIVDVLSRLDQSIYDSVLSFALILFLINKVAGIAATLVVILPGLAAAFMVARASTGSLGDQILMLIKQFGGFLLASQSILGGVTRLHQSLQTAKLDMLQLGTASLIAAGQFDAAEKEIRNLADAVGIRTVVPGIETPVNIEKVIDELQVSNQIDDATKKNVRALSHMRGEMRSSVDKINETKDFNLDDMFSDLAGDTKGVGRIQAMGELNDKIRGGLSSATGSLRSFAGNFTGIIGGRFGKIGGIVKTKMIIPVMSALGRFYAFVLAGAVSTFSTVAASAISALIPTGLLAGSLGTLAAPIIALVGAGAVLVGILTNMDKATAALSGALDALKAIVVALGSFLLDIFVGVWNLIAGALEGLIFIIKPFIDIFASVFKTGGDGGGVLSNLLSMIKLVGAAFNLLFTAVGQVLRVLGALIGFVVRIALIPLQFMIHVVDTLITRLLGFLGINTGGSALVLAIETIVSVLKMATQFVVELGDHIITFLNELMIKANKLSNAFGFDAFTGTMFGAGEIDPETGELVGAGGLATTKKESISEAKDAGQKLSKFSIPGFNFNEGNNITNNNIDADPDDKAALGRAVKRAIEKANSFERQRLGT
jgi:hypothetical protein